VPVFRRDRIFARRRRHSWPFVALAGAAAVVVGYITYQSQGRAAPQCDQEAVLIQLRHFLTRATREQHPRSIELAAIHEDDSRTAGAHTIMRRCSADAIIDFSVGRIVYEIRREEEAGPYHVVLTGS
jgi:hypothetical protein